MGKVKVIKSYKDLQKMLLFHPGEVHEVDDQRAAELEQRKLVEILPPANKTKLSK